MGKTQAFHSRGPWRQLVAVTAICPDGKVRKIRLAQSPDTYFSQRGRCRIRGVNVAGFVTTVDNHMWVPVTDLRAVKYIAENPTRYKPVTSKGILIDNPDAGEYEFRVPYYNPKFDAVMAACIKALCTCGWTAGHDSRCPATDTYLTVLAKEEHAVSA